MDYATCPEVLRYKKSLPSKDPLIRAEHKLSQNFTLSRFKSVGLEYVLNDPLNGLLGCLNRPVSGWFAASPPRRLCHTKNIKQVFKVSHVGVGPTAFFPLGFGLVAVNRMGLSNSGFTFVGPRPCASTAMKITHPLARHRWLLALLLASHTQGLTPATPNPSAG